MVDRWFGRLLEQLAVLGYDETTAVVHLSDHGHYFGDHGLQGKPFAELFWLYEGLIRTVLAIRLPAGSGAGAPARGQRIQALAQPQDVTATVLDLFGETMPGVLGHSLLPVIEGRRGPRELAFSSRFPLVGDRFTPVPSPPRSGATSTGPAPLRTSASTTCRPIRARSTTSAPRGRRSPASCAAPTSGGCASSTPRWRTGWSGPSATPPSASRPRRSRASGRARGAPAESTHDRGSRRGSRPLRRSGNGEVSRCCHARCCPGGYRRAGHSQPRSPDGGAHAHTPEGRREGRRRGAALSALSALAALAACRPGWLRRAGARRRRGGPRRPGGHRDHRAVDAPGGHRAQPGGGHGGGHHLRAAVRLHRPQGRPPAEPERQGLHGQAYRPLRRRRPAPRGLDAAGGRAPLPEPEPPPQPVRLHAPGQVRPGGLLRRGLGLVPLRRPGPARHAGHGQRRRAPDRRRGRPVRRAQGRPLPGHRLQRQRLCGNGRQGPGAHLHRAGLDLADVPRGGAAPDPARRGPQRRRPLGLVRPRGGQRVAAVGLQQRGRARLRGRPREPLGPPQDGGGLPVPG